MAQFRVDFGYNALGQRVLMNRYSDTAGTQFVVSATYLYDTFGNPASLQYTNAAGDALDGFTYRYNAFGQVASMVSLLDGESDYTYDANGQLIGVTDPASQGSRSATYTYDANGNRVQTTTDSATNSGYVTGANNALLSDGTYHYTYDAAGNRTGKTLIDQSSATTNTVVSTQYIWDNRNRLVEVIQQNGSGQTLVDIKYSYDAFDHLIGRDERDYTAGDGSLSSDVQNESKTEYVLDGNQLLEDFGSTPIVNGAAADDSVYLVDRYIAGPNVDEVLGFEKVPHPLTQPGTIFFTETDALESIRDLASSAGINVAHFQYNAYGKLESATNLLTGEPIGDLSQYTYVLFTGKLTDPVTGEQINWHRWYDPRTGSWLSLDPLGFAAGSLRFGGYVSNDPINHVDSLGLEESPLQLSGAPTYTGVVTLGGSMNAPTTGQQDSKATTAPWDEGIMPAIARDVPHYPSGLALLLATLYGSVWKDAFHWWKGGDPYWQFDSQAFDQSVMFQIAYVNTQWQSLDQQIRERARAQVAEGKLFGSESFTVEKKGIGRASLLGEGLLGAVLGGPHRVDVIHTVEFQWCTEGVDKPGEVSYEIASTYKWHDEINWNTNYWYEYPPNFLFDGALDMEYWATIVYKNNKSGKTSF